MRAILVQKFGDPGALQIGEAGSPHPGPGQVLVRVDVAGVNFSDTERRRAPYRVPDLPWIPGNEGAGVVESVGDGVEA